MRRACLPLLLALALSPACARPPAPTPTLSAAPAPTVSSARVPFITPSRITPDVLPDSHLIGTLPDGSRRYLVAGIRILERPDGSREQAKTRLPAGLYRSMELPSRLGGGLLFVASAGGTTLLYRAESWLGELSPVTRLPEASREVQAGFDRLYLRLQRGDEWIALDPQTGARLPLGPLPEGPRVGPLAFVDAWRAVAMVDLRGPMATFDAGASWRRLAIDDPFVTAVVTEGDDLILGTRTSRYRLGPEGELLGEPLERAKSAERSRIQRDGRAAPPSPRRSLLRATVEDGWPETGATALLARDGALSRIRLLDGAELSSNRRAYDPGLGTCHAIALGPGIGFVCGSPLGPTSIQAFEPPLGMREVLRFPEPRLVMASGTGGIAIRGSCQSDDAGPTTLCVRTRDGKSREVQLPSATGSERVVVLADGRIAIVIPPKERAEGRLSIVHEGGTTTLPLDLGELEGQGLEGTVFLEGFEEREPGLLAGWLDTGPAVRGIRIHLDGKVTLAPEAVDLGTTIVSGRFALALGSGSHRVRESVDGGFTFGDVDLPANLPRAAIEARSCGPVGCVAGGFLRVGWGEAEGKSLASPEPSPWLLPRARGLSLRCEATGEISGPLSPIEPAPTKANWLPFRGAPPPALGPGEVGFDSGTDPKNLRVLAPLRLYAWGPKGADWSRSGRWMARFDDRFALSGSRTTALAPSLFTSEESAQELLDPPAGLPIAWSAFVDPRGDAAALFACRSGKCASFGAVDGRPLLPVRDLDVASASPLSVVRLGETWFVLAPPAGSNAQQELALFRIDGGSARVLARLPRAFAGRDEAPRLVRRATSEGLGLVTLGPQDFETGARDFLLLEIDPETGQLGELARLHGSHLGDDPTPPLCPDDGDGWLMDAQPSPSPALRVITTAGSAAPVLTTSGVRLRLEVGHACIEALSARGEGLSALPTRRSGEALDPRAAIPLAATDTTTGRRHGLRCVP